VIKDFTVLKSGYAVVLLGMFPKLSIKDGIEWQQLIRRTWKSNLYWRNDNWGKRRLNNWKSICRFRRSAIYL